MTSIDVNMTRDKVVKAAPKVSTKARVRRAHAARPVSEVQPAAVVPDAPNATPAAPVADPVKPAKKHGKIWQFFHRRPKQ